MKTKWFSGLAILLFAGLFMTACPTDGIGDNAERKSLSSTGDPLPASRGYRDILPVSGGWIAVGELYWGTLDAPGAVIAKYDSQGKIVWEKAFGGSDLDIFYFAIEIADGYIVTARSNSSDGDLAGLRKQDTRGRVSDVTVKYDKNGTFLWAKQLNIGSFFGVIANDSGFLAVTGIKTSSGYLTALSDEIGPPYITQFDTDGDVIWQKPIGDNLELHGERSNTISISKIFAGPDGYFLLGQAYHVYDFTGDGSNGTSFIVSIGEDGTFRWQKAFQIPYYNIGSMIITNDGIVVAGAAHPYPDGGPNGPMIEKLDFAMNSVWTVPYQKIAWEFSPYLAEIDGNIFIAGTNYSAHENNYFLFGIDTDGAVFWDRELQDAEGKKYTQYRNIFRQDEGFIVYQYAHNDGVEDIPSNSFLFIEAP